MPAISADVEAEFAQIDREVEHLSLRLLRLDAGAPPAPGAQEEWEACTLCASATEKIYTGCERIMALLAAEVDGQKVIKSDNLHRVLLDRMSQQFAGRSPIITERTRSQLDRLRAFRHRERNSYGFALDAEIVFDRAREGGAADAAFVANVRNFLGAPKE